MATTKLKIRPDKSNRTGDLAIYVQVCINGKVKLYPTGQKVNQIFWDLKNEKVKKMPGNNDHTKINSIIDQKQQEIKDVIFNLEMNKSNVSFEVISENLIPKVEVVEDYSFEKWFRAFSESKTIETKKSTHSNYKALYHHVCDFDFKSPLSIKDINFSFYDGFKNWLIKERGLTNNTVNKRLKTLKTFLRFCSNHEVYDIANLTKFKFLEEKLATKIALTEKELMKIWSHDFSKNPRLERVRDLFVFSCATGLRESDVQNLKKENISGSEIIINTQKSTEEISIPLNNYSKAILEKYNFQLPIISQQKLNDYLKEVGRIAGIDDNQILVEFAGGKRKESIVPRYELLKSHVGRRTFITLSITKGIPIPVIQSITGHKDLSSFQKYIQINNKAKKDAMKLW